MDPPLITEISFSAANPSSYTLTEIWPFAAINGETGGGGLGLRMGNLVGGPSELDGSVEESTVTEQSVGGGGGGSGRKRRDLSLEDETSNMVSTTSSGNEFNNSSVKRMKVSGYRNENVNSNVEIEASSAAKEKSAEQNIKPSELPKQDYIHVGARRGQATDSHSLVERARRENISERMKILQDLVPGCIKIIGKALVLDEIINYAQSLQRQVEFLSMKLEAVNSRMNVNPTTEGFQLKDKFTILIWC
ncbi:hypothetical protein MANES_02G197700v8 [Manihot esculenta]|uniref:Uncharacterized protein n=1 Tax=Manihot esculenta TaxID=3983 RepID=A0ACB7I974_MANES|nr:hypothetical protein MANES_02G197700v8 [Manihot esculenta]